MDLGFWVACQHSSRMVIIAGFDLEALNPNFLISFYICVSIMICEGVWGGVLVIVEW